MTPRKCQKSIRISKQLDKKRTRCAFLLVETIAFIDFVVLKDHLIVISGYLYTPFADQVY